jgi:hypothetical protein
MMKTHLPKALMLASVLAVSVAFAGQAQAGNQRDYAVHPSKIAPAPWERDTTPTKETYTQQPESQGSNNTYADGDRFRQDRCDLLKNNSKAKQREGCM